MTDADAKNLQRVLAEPGSTAARKALAAEWRASGNPQVDLIDAQLEYRELERANKTSSPAAKALLVAIDRSIAQHGSVWAGALTKLVDSLEYRRGLIAKVTLSGERFLAVAPELFAHAPIQHVDFEAPLALDKLLASPFLGKLGSLAIQLQYAAFGDREAIAVARTRQLAGLRWLSLYANGIGEAGVEALAASPYLEGCVYLGLVDNPCDPTPSVVDYDGTEGVSRPPIADQLERSYGKRPWLSGPAPGEPWPPDRDDLVVTP